MKRVLEQLVLSVFFLSFFLSFPALSQEATIGWLSLEDVENVYKTTSKPFLIFFKNKDKEGRRMENTIYTNPKIIKFVNQFFIPIKIEKPSSSKHLKKEEYDFYQHISEDNVSSTYIFYPQENIKIRMKGYADVIRMQACMIYIIEKAYLATNIDFFIEEFEKVFRPEEGIDKLIEPDLYWIPFRKMDDLYKKTPRKALVYLGAKWSNTSKMAERNIFNNPEIRKLIQDNFYCFHLDVNSRDTVNFFQYSFTNAGEDAKNFHELALLLSNDTIRVPSICILDETGKILEQLYFYQDKEKLTPKLEYWGKNFYREMSQEEYIAIREKERM